MGTSLDSIRGEAQWTATKDDSMMIVADQIVQAELQEDPNNATMGPEVLSSTIGTTSLRTKVIPN